MGDAPISTGRRYSEARMASTCVITRVSNGAWDEAILDYADIEAAVYTGRCRLKFAANRVLSRDAEGQILAAQELLLFLPIAGTGGVRPDDRVLITDGGPDPALTGAVFRVTGLFPQTFATSRRLPVEALT
jgi:Family of unknown function (DUF6093)